MRKSRDGKLVSLSLSWPGCRALPEDLGGRHDASEMQSSGGKKWGEENRHIAELVLN